MSFAQKSDNDFIGFHGISTISQAKMSCHHTTLIFVQRHDELVLAILKNDINYSLI
jgi:hypothetical protein